MASSPSLSNSTALRDESVLRRVRHLGSARDGLQEWRLQRRTALALIPLGLYFVASILRLATSDQVTAAAWLASPVPALLTILFVLALLAHAVVGMRSVLVDYVHTSARLVAAELLVRGAAVVLGGASVLAVLKLFLGRWGGKQCPTATTSSIIPSTSSFSAREAPGCGRHWAWSRPG